MNSRQRRLVLLILAASAAFVLAPTTGASARVLSCNPATNANATVYSGPTDITSTAWAAPVNWSNGTPTSGRDACLTAESEYRLLSGTFDGRSLQIGPDVLVTAQSDSTLLLFVDGLGLAPGLQTRFQLAPATGVSANDVELGAGSAVSGGRWETDGVEFDRAAMTGDSWFGPCALTNLMGGNATTVDAGVTLTVSGTFCDLDVYDRNVTINGRLEMDGGARIFRSPGRLGGVTLAAAATLAKIHGNPSGTATMAVPFRNHGVVRAPAGVTFDFTGGQPVGGADVGQFIAETAGSNIRFTGGTRDLAAPASGFTFSGPGRVVSTAALNLTGDITIGSGSTLVVDGVTLDVGNTLVTNGGTVELAGGADALTTAGGQLTGGAINVTGAATDLTDIGTTTADILTISGAQTTLQNDPVLSTLTMSAGADLTAPAGITATRAAISGAAPGNPNHLVFPTSVSGELVTDDLQLVHINATFDTAPSSYEGATGALAGDWSIIGAQLNLPNVDGLTSITSTGALTLGGQFATIFVNASPALEDLSSIAAGGTIRLQNGIDMTSASPITNAGAVHIGPGSQLTSAGFTQSALTASLAIALGSTPSSAGRFTASGGAVSITGGTMSVDTTPLTTPTFTDLFHYVDGAAASSFTATLTPAVAPAIAAPMQLVNELDTSDQRLTLDVVEDPMEGPGEATNLRGTLPGIWTNEPAPAIAFDDADDGAGSGTAGYSIVWDNSASTVATTTQNLARDVEFVTAPTQSATTDSLYLHIRPVDFEGNWGATQTIGPFKVDLTAPTVSTASVAPGPLARSVVVSGTAGDAHSGVANVQVVDQARGVAVCSTTIRVDGTWSCSAVQLNPGNYSLTAIATDVVGASATSGTASVTIPEVPMVSSSPTAPGGVAVVAFASLVAVTYRCAIDDGPAAACVSPFTTPKLAVGAHVVRVTAVTPEGFTSDATPVQFTVPVPLTAPKLSKLVLKPALVTAAKRAKLSWALDKAATVQLKLQRKVGRKWSAPISVTVTARKGAGSYTIARTIKGKALAKGAWRVQVTAVSAGMRTATFTKTFAVK